MKALAIGNGSARRRSSWVLRAGGRVRQYGTALLACSLLAVPLSAQKSRPGEYEVKAAYLYNFGKFLTWPAQGALSQSNSPFQICVLGQDPFGAALDSTLSGEQIDGEVVVARRIQKPQDALTCRIVFISSSEELRLKAILGILRDAPVLTVSDLPGFGEQGGMIHFVLEEQRVRFEVNLTAAERAHLVLSSQLLKVASAVKREGKE